ncbi:MAG: carboxylating nicotinate-nucleotide diphosphorylase [Gammaproteobacteria bacterium]|nr:carboxylating nicotinate-nucleotide diphosphorylase [Gammaproteobacteria bacterium]MYB38222.1 carboxylating nicotinate-nucleotide diphosphorylase [Gammaproteobacteria bacterium]
MRADPETVKQNVACALAEDIGAGDINAELIEPEAQARARLVTRSDMVLCGRPWVVQACGEVDRRIATRWFAEEGEAVTTGSLLLELTGPARALLTVERTVVNFVQVLSAAATAARRYSSAVAGFRTATGKPVTILDTRKTLPGLRHAQKYAVAAGGATNHRMGLFDAFLLKENHIAAAGSIAAAVHRARSLHPNVKLEVEVENNEELQEAIAAGADMVLLDNYTPDQMREAVTLNANRIPLEASGGITLATIAPIAATGVDYISIGDITKAVAPPDLSMRLERIG